MSDDDDVPALKPCPFCGLVPPMRWQKRSEDLTVYFMRCACGMESAHHASEEAAVLYWNRRPREPEMPEDTLTITFHDDGGKVTEKIVMRGFPQDVSRLLKRIEKWRALEERDPSSDAEQDRVAAMEARHRREEKP